MVIDYERNMAYRRSLEIMFSELSEKEMDSFSVTDEYGLENFSFQVGGYDVQVKDALLAEALNVLTERKREVILLSYFMEMSDADIARKLHLVRSTVHEHRTRSLELLKIILEDNKYDHYRKNRDNKKLVPFQTIKRASEGDDQAINEILKHYEGYIANLSIRKMYDEYGAVHFCVDETLRRRLETKLINTIFKFKLVR